MSNETAEKLKKAAWQMRKAHGHLQDLLFDKYGFMRTHDIDLADKKFREGINSVDLAHRYIGEILEDVGAAIYEYDKEINGQELAIQRCAGR